VGLVVAGNLPEALRGVRMRMPDVWILAPGIGAQGGTLTEALAAGLRADGEGLLVHVSRGIARAPSPADAARELHEQIRRHRDGLPLVPSPGVVRETPQAEQRHEDRLRADIVRGLLNTGCFRLGRFTLKSGVVSPFYIDLRMIISDPPLLRRVAEAYARMLEPLDFARIAGIPLAGAPLATAVSLRTGRPVILPRLEKKDHGSGRRIEGAFEPGERVVLLDDLITAGTSKIEAAAVLREEGLVVEDLVVLVERGRQGREELGEAGIRLHAALSVDQLLSVCLELGLIDRAQHEEILSFLAST